MNQEQTSERAEYLDDIRPHLFARLKPYLAPLHFASDEERAQHKADFERFRAFWAETAQLGVEFPVEPDLLAFYVVIQTSEGSSVAEIKRTVEAIDYFSEQYEYHSPVRDEAVRAALELASKEERKPDNQKDNDNAS